MPRASHRPGQHPAGLVIAYENFFIRVPSQLSAEHHRDIVKKYKAAREGLPYEVTADNQVDDISEENGKETKPGKEEYEKPENNATDKKPEETEKFRQVKHSAHQSDTIYSQAPTFDSTTPKRSELLSNNKNGIIIGTIIGSAIILFGLIYLIFFNNQRRFLKFVKPPKRVYTVLQDAGLSKKFDMYDNLDGAISTLR